MKIWNRNTDGEELRRYLLGNLSEVARERVDRRVLNEAEINEEIQATEDALIDQYLGDKLNSEERKRFESYFLVPKERQQKLRFGRTLRRYLDSLPGMKTNKNVNNLSLARFRWLEPRAVLVGSVVVVCLAVLCALWLVNQRRVERGSNRQTLAITLAPGSSRADDGRIKRITLPASYGTVEVQLEMGSNEYPRYEVQLLKERQSINIYKSLEALKKNGRLVVALVIPAQLFEPGDYTFKLSGATNSGQIEYQDEYQLRVTPSP